MIFRALNPLDWSWVQEHINCTLMADTKGIVAEDDHEILGVLVFDTWTYTSVCTHIGVTDSHVWKEGLLQEGYKYVFDTCGRKMMLGTTISTKVDPLKFFKALGWQEIYRLKDGYDEGVDIVYSQFTVEQWRMKRAA